MSGRTRTGSWRKSVRGVIVSKLETLEKEGKPARKEVKLVRRRGAKPAGKFRKFVRRFCGWRSARRFPAKLADRTCKTFGEIDETQKCPLAPAHAFTPPCRKGQARPRRITEAGGGPVKNTRG